MQQGGALGDVTIPLKAVAPASATTGASVSGNLPSGAAVGDQLVRDVKVYDANGASRDLSLTFTKSATGWDVAGSDANGATATGALTFTNGVLTGGGTLAVGGVNVDLSTVTGYADLTTVAFKDQNGKQAGTLQSFTLSKDGTLIGLFSNGDKQAVGRIALATFVNPGGLEKAGGSTYRQSVNSGNAQLGGPGDGRPRNAAGRLARDVERRPLAGVHEPDRRPARLPGERPHHHDLRRGAAGAHQPQALARPVRKVHLTGRIVHFSRTSARGGPETELRSWLPDVVRDASGWQSPHWQPLLSPRLCRPVRKVHLTGRIVRFSRTSARGRPSEALRGPASRATCAAGSVADASSPAAAPTPCPGCAW